MTLNPSRIVASLDHDQRLGSELSKQTPNEQDFQIDETARVSGHLSAESKRKCYLAHMN